MKGNELVWRTIIDGAVTDERRRWDNYADLAFKAGVPETTAQLACRKLLDIGAIAKRARGGFSVVSPEKVLTVACGARNLTRDTLTRTSRAFLSQDRSGQTGHQVILGGPDAAVHLLGGENIVADISARIAYVPQDAVFSDFPPGGDLTILRMDDRARLDWYGGFASFAQTYVDLFATPGWQASEFRMALRDRFMRARDWDQG